MKSFRVPMTWPPAMLCGFLALSLAAEAQIAAPVFVPLDADGITPFAVTVTTTTPGAQIRYTLNGADPVLTDLPIASGGSITVNRLVTLKAKAWVGANSSPVTTSTFSVTGALSAGETHSLLLSSAMALRGAGNQGSGRLGNDVPSGNTPTPVVSQYTSPVSAIGDAVGLATGMDHSLFVKLNAADGVRSAWSFGDNTTGELGNNSTAVSHRRAVQVLTSTSATAYLTGVHEVAAGTNFSLAAHTDGSVYAWGTKSNGRLGDGQTTSFRKYADKVQMTGGTLPLAGIRSVSAANGSGFGREAHSMEIPGSSGRVWAWGLNSSGQLGVGNSNVQTRAALVRNNLNAELTDVWDVSAGELHTAVVRWRVGTLPINGRVWCFGQQSNGRLGNGSTATAVISLPPLDAVKRDESGFPFLEQITAVAAGAAHTLALDELGNVWSWGLNSGGALGDASTSNRSRAVRVKAQSPPVPQVPPLEDRLGSIVAISAGGSGSNGWSMALAADGTVYAWGRNANGQHGNGTTSTTAVTRPVAIPNFKLLPGYPEAILTKNVSPPGAPGTVLLTASPTDPDGPGTITNIKFYVNGTIVSNGTALTHSYVPTVAGTYHAFAIVTDNTGIQAQSPPVSFTLHSPSVTLALSDLQRFAPGPVGLTATPTDLDGASDIDKIRFYSQGSLVGELDDPPWTFPLSGLAEGSHEAQAVVVDHFNLEGSSAVVPFTILPPPELDLTVTLDLPEPPGQATFTASLTDPSVLAVDVFVDGIPLGGLSAPPWDFTTAPDIEEGPHQAYATAYFPFGYERQSPLLSFLIGDSDADGMVSSLEVLVGRDPAVASPVADSSVRKLDVFNLSSF